MVAGSGTAATFRVRLLLAALPSRQQAGTPGNAMQVLAYCLLLTSDAGVQGPFACGRKAPRKARHALAGLA